MIGRDGLLDMMQLANAKAIDVVIVEHQDRLSRDMEDTAHIFKRLTFLGIQLVGVHDGEATTMTLGMRAIMAQMFREDNVHKVRRGMSGLVRNGLSAGGKAYGYQPDPANRGKPVIVPEEAEIVQMIYEAYAAGKSPKAISHALNARMIPPPRGRLRSPSTLIGEGWRGSGILRNPIYRGQIVWNKVTMVKDPNTGRRLSRPNPPEQWQTVEAPELRIVSDVLFAQVQAQLHGRSRAVAGDREIKKKRPTRILSGLLRCGACGAGMSAAGKDKSGRTRLRCSAHVNSHSCPDPATFYLDVVEKLVIDSLCSHLTDPRLLYEYAKEYQAERRRLNGSKLRRIAEIKNRIEWLDKDSDRLLDWAQRDLGDPEKLLAKMKEHSQEQARLKEELASMDQPEIAVDLHPAAIEHYAKALTSARELFDKHELGGDSETARALREVIDRVTVYRRHDTEKGIEIELTGRFAPLMPPADPQKTAVYAPQGGKSVHVVVAEEGLEPPTRGL